MEEHHHPVEVVEPPVPAASTGTGGKRGKRKQPVARQKKEAPGRAKKKPGGASADEEQPTGRLDGVGIKVLEFDHCAENHFRAMDTIAELCGEAEDGDGGIDESDIQRFSSSAFFLRYSWLHVLVCENKYDLLCALISSLPVIAC